MSHLVRLPYLDSGEECGSEEPSPPTRALQVHDSDDAWLDEICHAPRRILHVTASDDEWAETLCRSTPSHLQFHGGASPRPSFDGPYTSLLDLAESNSSPCPSFDGPYTSLPELRSQAAVYMRLPEPVWPEPEQDAIVDDAISQSSPMSGGPSLVTGEQAIIGKCCWRFAAWSQVLRDVFAFKIGVAYDPVHRWWNEEFGYNKDQTWMFMDVIHAGSAAQCCWLERALIFRLGSIRGCHNASGGGEGISTVTSAAGGESPLCHCYIVYAPAGSGVGLRAAFLARKRQRTTQ